MKKKNNKKYGHSFNTTNIAKRGLSLGGTIVLCILLLFYGFYAYTKTGTVVPTAELFDGKPTFRFVDVGQGSCTLITYGAHAVLVDAGGSGCADETAEYVRLYAPSVDYMIITHPHEDHMGGAAKILSQINVDTLVMRDISVSEKFYVSALSAAKKHGTEIERVSSASEYDAGEIHIELFDIFDLEYDDLNDASMVVRVTAGKTSVLLTGDAGRDAEALLLWRDGDKLASDILALGHHGSNTSTSEGFLSAVSPEKCVVSCGKNNSYGHPAPAVVQRVKASGAELYRTDRQGTVVLRGETDEKE